MRVTGVSSVLLNISDLARSKRFYGELLGLPLAFETDDHHVAVFGAGGTSVVLHHHEELADQGSPPGQDEPGAVMLFLRVEDVDAAAEELRAAGVEIVSEPTDQEWGQREASVLDPDGYHLTVEQPLAG